MSALKGCIPSKKDGRDFLLANHAIPTVEPAFGFGHGNTYTDWAMNGNGAVEPGEVLPANWTAARKGAGNCVAAARINELKCMLTDAGMSPAEAHVIVGDAEVAIKLYMAVYQFKGEAAYNPETGENDNGLEIRARLEHDAKVGTTVANGSVHTIGIYAQVNVANLNELLFAIKNFDAVPSGITVNNANEETFNAKFPQGHAQWGSEGPLETEDHCIPLVGRPTDDETVGITWSKPINLLEAFREKRMFECWAYLSPDRISKVTGKDYEGASEAVLEEYVALVQQAQPA
jgi:hypothetical protein